MFEILFSNDHFIVVNKPAFINVHRDEHGPGFAEQLSEQLDCRLYVVHRLDKVTSGLMLFAKSSEDAALFGEMFTHKKIEKLYVAISDKKPKKKQGSIKGGMEKSRRGMWRLTSHRENMAITRFVSQSYPNGGRIFLLKPETGKTHQLRVALKSLSAPILGDPLYAVSQSDKIDRCYLHAWRLSFSFRGEEYRFYNDPDFGECFTSDVFKDLLKLWSDPDSIKWPTK